MSDAKKPAQKLALTDRHMRALRADPAGRRVTVWDSLMPGMCVRVTPDKGRRSFYVVRRRAGDTSPTWHLLGTYPDVTLAEAREAAREALTALMAGKHPKRLAEEKRLAAEAKTREAEANNFAAVAKKFVQQYLPRIRSAKTYEAYLRREIIPALGARPIHDIRRREVVALLEGIAARSGAPAARVALAVLRKCLNWALSRDLAEYESNPAAQLSAGDILGTAAARDRLLSDAELAEIWPAIEKVGEPFATVYRLLLLTGARFREVAEARWEDLDLEAGTLTIPAGRSKNRDAMLIPLSPGAVALFRDAPRFAGPFIFGIATAGQRPPGGLTRAKRRLDAALAVAAIPPFVVHDFRRCVRSGLGRLGVPVVVAELCLGHAQRGVVGVYDRYGYIDEKRDALARWERHLIGVVEPAAPGANVVVAMPARARG